MSDTGKQSLRYFHFARWIGTPWWNLRFWLGYRIGGFSHARRDMLDPQEFEVVLHQREGDALLALLEKALNAGMDPGIGLRRDDATAAGVKIEIARSGVAL